MAPRPRGNAALDLNLPPGLFNTGSGWPVARYDAAPYRRAETPTRPGNATQELADAPGSDGRGHERLMGLCCHRAYWGYAVHTSGAFPGIPWGCLHPEVSLPYGLSVSSGL